MNGSEAFARMHLQLERMRVRKSCLRPEEFELPAGKLLLAIIREFLDQRIFAGHDLGKIEAESAFVNSPNFGLAGLVHYFSGVQESLCWHTPSQNAKAADF